MLLDRDEFVVSFNPSKTTEAKLIAKIKEAGYTAQVVDAKAANAAAIGQVDAGYNERNQNQAEKRKHNPRRENTAKKANHRWAIRLDG